MILENTKYSVLQNISPTPDEHEQFEKLVKKLVRKLRKSAKQNDLKCEFFVGGSFGKGTYLKGSFDADIFCRFDPSYDDSSLSTYLEKIILDSKIKYKKQKGSRDYFSGKFGGRKLKINFEVIPVRKINKTKDALNSTDLSIFHVQFIKDKIAKNPSLSSEIRLAKQFFKAKRLYGAESYINGFSGHVIDILVSYYGSFENLVEAARSWTENTYIDINGFYDSYDEAISSIGLDKLSNLLIIDPIIKERNAARALDEDNYYRFLFEVNNIDHISEDDFQITKKDYKEIIKESKQFAKNNNLKFLSYQVKFSLGNESEDIVGSKLKKINKKLIKYFESFDFDIFKNDFFIDMNKGICLFIFLFEKTLLPKVKKIEGPKVYMQQAVKGFVESKKDYDFFVDGGRVCIYEMRRVEKINEISNLTIFDLENMLNKDISFVKKLRKLN